MKSKKLITVFLCMLVCVLTAICVAACNSQKTTLSSFSVVGEEEVVVGEFDYGDYSLKLNYSDDSTKTVPFLSDYLSADDAQKLTTVGTHTVTVKYEGQTVNFTVKITKPSYDMSGVTFTDKSVTYDGQVHSVEAPNLPQGVSVTYENNGKTAAGTYTVTAHFVGDDEKYAAIPDKTATLTINKKELEVNFIGSTTLTYTGNEQKTLSVEATNVVSGDNVTLALYTVTATVSGNDNYCLTQNNTATVTITRANHRVVFIQQGYDAIIKDVLDLADLTDIPTPKQQVTGYTVVWDRTDFTAITEDITVNTQNRPNTYKVTYMYNDTKVCEETATYNAAYTIAEHSPEANYEIIKWTDGVTDYTTNADITVNFAKDITLRAKQTAYMFPDSTFAFLGETATITGYTGNAAQLDIHGYAKHNSNYYPVTAIGGNVFKDNTTLTSVVIGEDITEVGEGAFYNCLNLERVEIGAKVRHFGFQAFRGCKKLDYVNFTGTLNDWFKIMFGYTKEEQIERVYSSDKTIIEYNDNSEDNKLRNANPMEYAYDLHVKGTLVTQITAADLAGIDHISDCAFSRTYSNTAIMLSDDVKSVGYYAFCTNPAVNVIGLGNSLEVLGKSAVGGSYGVRELTLPSTMKVLHSKATPFGTLLKCFKITNNSPLIADSTVFTSISKINYDLFTVNGLNRYGQDVINTYTTDEEGFVWLTSSAKPNDIYLVDYVGTQTDITIPTTHDGRQVVISSEAFAGNHTIERLTVPLGFKNIPDRILVYSQSIREVIVEDEIETLGTKAFMNTTLKKLTFKKGCRTFEDTSLAPTDGLELTINNTVDVAFKRKSCSGMKNAVINYAGTIAQFKAAAEQVGLANIFVDAVNVTVKCSDGSFDPTQTT